MAVNEEIVTGKKFRRLIDIATNKWRRYSFWNKAKDTECEDGTDVETKVGAIKGITTSTNVSETGYAADAKTVSEINQSLGLLREGIQAVSKKQNFCKGSDRLLTDVLLIDFTNPTGESNSYGVIATEDASKLLNSPVTDGAFYAYREVLTIKSVPKDYKVIVKLTEAYPSPGRTWIKAYNPNISDWSDWKVI